ncbi:MAG: hypothetical protein RL463_852 [Bacteroidota bacterium]|jgi:8-oxo-dGTP diphosphatase
METQFQYRYARPALTADCVIFSFDGAHLRLLLIKRDNEPFKNQWALPGGFVRIEETTEGCAARVLQEKAGLENVFIEQLYTFGALDRDPRERVISVAYFALINKHLYELSAGINTVQAEWFDINELPKIAFDHLEIVNQALKRLKGKVRYQPVGFELLDEKFTLPQLQQLYEAILGTAIDKRNFRKKIIGMNLLIALDEKEQNVAHKAARYYSFDKIAYQDLSESGFNFEI